VSIDLPLSRILDEIQSVVLERHEKYGPTNISNSPGGPLNGLRVRLHDKLARLNNSVDNGVTDFDDDSFRDCFIDVVGYGLIGLLVVDGDWPDGSDKPLEKMVDRTEPVVPQFSFEPLKDLVDRAQVARVLGASLDHWPVGSTFRATNADWTWHRGADGWTPSDSRGHVIDWEKLPSLRAVASWYGSETIDGTITEPSNLQKEAA
jgi:hypothetical protein